MRLQLPDSRLGSHAMREETMADPVVEDLILHLLEWIAMRE
jgi:hypothetical protein